MSGFWRAVGGKRWGGLVLSCSLLAGAGATPVGQRALADANHFLGYYRALDRASIRPSFWNRIALSLAWTSAERRDSCHSSTASSGRPS